MGVSTVRGVAPAETAACVGPRGGRVVDGGGLGDGGHAVDRGGQIPAVNCGLHGVLHRVGGDGGDEPSFGEDGEADWLPPIAYGW